MTIFNNFSPVRKLNTPLMVGGTGAGESFNPKLTMKTELIDVIKEIAMCSTVFNERVFIEPDPPKPAVQSVTTELSEAIELTNSLTYELRRLENRLVLIKARLDGLDIPTRS